MYSTAENRALNPQIGVTGFEDLPHPISDARISSGFSESAAGGYTIIPGIEALSAIHTSANNGSDQGTDTPFLQPHGASYESTLLEVRQYISSDPIHAANLLLDIPTQHLNFDLYEAYEALARNLSERLGHQDSYLSAQLMGSTASLEAAIDEMSKDDLLVEALGGMNLIDFGDQMATLEDEMEAGVPDPATAARLTRFINIMREVDEIELAATNPAPQFAEPPTHDPRRLIPTPPQ